MRRLPGLEMTGLIDPRFSRIRKNQHKPEVAGVCPFPFDPANEWIPSSQVIGPDPILRFTPRSVASSEEKELPKYESLARVLVECQQKFD